MQQTCHTHLYLIHDTAFDFFLKEILSDLLDSSQKHREEKGGFRKNRNKQPHRFIEEIIRRHRNT